MNSQIVVWCVTVPFCLLVHARSSTAEIQQSNFNKYTFGKWILYVMFLYDQINIDPSLTFTVPWLDVYYWSINIITFIITTFWLIFDDPFRPPGTPPLQLDLSRISGWNHRTRPFIQTVGYHYCKLLSPARAMEWIYVDGLKAWIEKQVVWLGCLELRPDRVSKLVQLLHLYCCHLWLTCSWSLFRSSMVQRMSPRLLFERRTRRFLARDHGMENGSVGRNPSI